MNNNNHATDKDWSREFKSWLVAIRTLGYGVFLIFLFLLFDSKAATSTHTNMMMGLGFGLFLGAIFYYGFGKYAITGWNRRQMLPYFRPYIVGGILWSMLAFLYTFL